MLSKELQDILGNDSLSSVSLIEKSLQTIQQQSHLNAFITVDSSGARTRAQELDNRLRKQGKVLGPLHGIPIAIKDNIHVAGLPNTAGTPALKNFIPSEDASVVKRLRVAGAIILGKNNMHELAFGVTSHNRTFGTVRNAYNSNYIAGGSSGGTAVAVAIGMATIGLATDTGGSSRIPAALNGLAGLRPTIGRYPSDGITRISHTRDTVGIIAHHATDIALVDSVLSGDPLSLEEVQLRGLRLGIPKSYFYSNLESAVAEQVEVLLKQLKFAGVELIEADIEDVAELNHKVGFPIVLYEARQLLQDYITQNLPDESLETVTNAIASPDVKLIMDNVVGGSVTETIYLEALNTYRPQLKKVYRDYFKHQNVDAVIFPTLALSARSIDDSLETVSLNGKQVPTFGTYIRNTDPASNAGIPALTIPFGQSEQGMPIGIEINGPEGKDQQLLAIGNAIEILVRQQSKKAAKITTY